jgi:hypothetical protein
MAVDPREAATFSTDAEISAMTPVEWLIKHVGDDYTPAQLLAISSANDRWYNTYFGNGASSLNLRPGGAAMGEDNIDIALEIERGMGDPEAHIISELNRIAGSSATVLEVKLVAEGRMALVRLQGAHALHATPSTPRCSPARRDSVWRLTRAHSLGTHSSTRARWWWRSRTASHATTPSRSSCRRPLS